MIAAQTAGAHRFRYVDTPGLLDPFSTFEIFTRLRAESDLALEIHAHNDLGMATAISLAAARAGADSIATTVNGLGERAGHAPLEEVALALRHVQGDCAGIQSGALRPLSMLVAKASGRAISPNKAVVGTAIFLSESAPSQSNCCTAKRSPLLDPAEFGCSHQVMLGKYSEAHDIERFFQEMGSRVSPQEVQGVLEQVQHHYSKSKAALSSADLWHLRNLAAPLASQSAH